MAAIRRVLIASAAAFGATTFGIGTTTSPWVAGALLGALGLALTLWNVVAVSLRQAIVPGHDRIALGVGLDNRDARRLYGRLGYVDWGHGTVMVSWVERDHDGPPVRASEMCDVLVKRL